MDGVRIKQRLGFVHRWFLSKHVINWEKKKMSPAHICNEDGICNLDDDDALNDGIEVPDVSGESLLTEFEEDDLTELFEEAFSLIMVMRELTPYSEKFKKTVEPEVISFKDDQTLFVSHQ